jgi:hypothetical protein
VIPLIDDIKYSWVFVGSLHLLRRHAALRIPVRATVIAPESDKKV